MDPYEIIILPLWILVPAYELSIRCNHIGPPAANRPAARACSTPSVFYDAQREQLKELLINL